MFAALDPDEFLAAFMLWAETVRHTCRAGVVAIDGKALRRARAAGEPVPVIVGAWGARAGISLGQVKVDEKGNQGNLYDCVTVYLDAVGSSWCLSHFGYFHGSYAEDLNLFRTAPMLGRHKTEHRTPDPPRVQSGMTIPTPTHSRSLAPVQGSSVL